MVETRGEVIDSMDRGHRGQCIAKGNRTKCQRGAPSDPLALSMACSSSKDRVRAGSVSQGGTFNFASDNVSSSGTAGPESSVDRAAEGTGIEEDMANCLILLTRGKRMKPPSPAEPAAAGTSAGGNGGDGETGVDPYRCRTCNRCFPSFQALGGHRASHKKPRPMVNFHGEEKLAAANSRAGDADRSSFTDLSLHISSGRGILAQSTRKSKVHECSVCGAGFKSGQALGGHMRRHRALVPPAATAVGATSSISFGAREAGKDSGNVLHLDLNLPAPEVCEPEYSSLTIPKERVHVFLASSLVDCHY